MSRRWLLTLPLAATLLLGACGGGGDDDAENPSEETAAADQTTQARGPGLPTPTPVADEGIAVTVIGNGTTYQPTVAEFRQLPTVQIEADGTRTGPTLDVVASQVGWNESTVVTIQGLTEDLNNVAYIRYPLADIAQDTILEVDEQGHLNLYSTVLPKDDWLKVVVAITLTDG